ncbi:MAG: UDP-N-acetylmuramate dehydrogenase [Gammaproteobacteria bacterium]|nr:UDP-N-acetylmuramate dehydrogenase [Gammaproteobacteria bacterium]MBT3489741.1 UDP-N-acetylmuramate dehydrogenase [Gammaproteobacteria bacterium]MBT3719702.1 UDP-N-acetylmuramate dehydrogenase [Gammaproteobacteria bacterium]MBT3845476.1 UDP-N-acetylmuramate dehydrogenase [Gammaproteobacteria bacterium]MBT3892879.1 UDP-N-acetylmuramate dehydrogenase [Gammaproteobacteria bacterium]
MNSTAQRLENVALAPYTSWRVGGVADRLYIPETRQQLVEILQQLPGAEPLLWVGKGSNLLVRDGGFRGTVILLANTLERLEWRDNDRLYAEAGAPLSRLARVARSEQWRGLDFLAGIPGSVGGALAMNAGAFGQEIWSRVESVEVVDRGGVVETLMADRFQANYRALIRIDDTAPFWFLSAIFQRSNLDREETHEKMQQQLKQRNATQPMSYYSCGSVFKNPQGDHAGRLIEAAGLKGFTLGGARVSEQHANFIIHQGEATATEIEALMDHVAQEVEQKFGVSLQREVRIVGQVERCLS